MSTKAQHTRVSKFLSLVLRHRPEKIGIALDREGWVSVPRLLDAFGARGLSLTPDELRTAAVVGRRYGRPVVLRVANGEMQRDGHLFFRPANGVWLTERVPARYITFGGDDRR